MSQLVATRTVLVNDSQTITYNGVAFGWSNPDGHNLLPPIFQFQMTPVYDSSDRFVLYHRYQLTVETVIFPDSQADIEELRRKLSAPRGSLVIGSALLWGTAAESNVPIDVTDGPHPRSVSVKPVAGFGAYLVNWTVEFSMVRCDTQPVTGASLTYFESFIVTQSIGISQDGLISRNLTGEWTIPKAAATTGYTAIIADSKRLNLTVNLPTGYERVNQSYNQSADGRKVSFAVSDRQLQGDVYPSGMIEADGSFTLSSDSPGGWGGFAQGFASVQVNYRLAPLANKTLAAVHFFAYIGYIAAALNDRLADASVRGLVLPVSIAHNRGLFKSDRNITWGCKFKLAGCIRSMFVGDDIFTEEDGGSPIIPRVDWATWQASVSSAHRPYGYDALFMLPSESVEELSSCADQNTAMVIGQHTQGSTTEGTPTSYTFTCPEITEANSFLRYVARIYIQRDENAATWRKAIAYTPAAVSSTEGFIGGGSDPIKTGPAYAYPSSPASDASNVIDYQGVPHTRVAIAIAAVRIGFKVGLPVIETIDGKDAKQVATSGHHEVIGEIAGCPVYSYSGYVVYEVEGEVNEVKLRKNRLFCTDDMEYGDDYGEEDL